MADRDLCGRILGQFILREQIGAGGCGVVYRCEQPILKRDAVIKVLRERRGRSDVLQARFVREAQLASRLDHPYAAHVYAFGVEADGLRWIAMELVQGVTLDAWLRERGPMPLEQFVPFFEHVANVVSAAHAYGIVHRDLKPSNIMVIDHGAQLLPKLLDFGIAKLGDEPEPPTMWAEGSLAENCSRAELQASTTRPDPSADDELTPEGKGMGSWAYMPPEQWGNAREVGVASDIYSLGTLAYKALTGRLPFTASSEIEYHHHHVYSPVPPLGGGHPVELERAIHRALAKKPEQRQANVHELAAELRAALRASERELLRSSARQWDERKRPAGLLWGSDMVAQVQRWSRSAPPGMLSDLECSFVAASQRRARHAQWLRRASLVVAALSLVAGLVYRTVMQARLAQEQAESSERVATAAITQSELEQGRSALLHDEPDAAKHLAEAYRRGDRNSSTTFMLARALQPRLAEQARLASSVGNMWSARFSPRGDQIVTTDEQNARLWDARTYQLLNTLPHGDVVYRAAYSADGTRLVTACGDGRVRIWDATTGALVRELAREGSKPRYYRIAFSPRGDRVAATALDNDIFHLWNADTGELIVELHNAGKQFSSLAASSDGQWIATSGGDGVVVLDSETGHVVSTIPASQVLVAVFDPTGPRLATGTLNGDVSLWSVTSGTLVQHIRQLGDRVDTLAISPNGRLIAMEDREGEQLIWDIANSTLRGKGHLLPGRAKKFEFSPTSKLLVVAGSQGSSSIVDVETVTPISRLDGDNGIVADVNFDADSRRVLTASWDGTARVWDATSAYHRWGSPERQGDCDRVTSLESDRRFVVVPCRGRPTQIWNTDTKQLLAEIPEPTWLGNGFITVYPAVSSDGALAAVTRGNTVEVYAVPGGKRVRTISHRTAVSAIAFSARGHELASGDISGDVMITRADGSVVNLASAPDGIDTVGFLQTGEVVITDAQRRFRAYASDGHIRADLMLPARARFLRFSADGARLLAVPSFMAQAAHATLWDMSSYRMISEIDSTSHVYSARFLSDNAILTGHGDNAVRLWNAAGQLSRVYQASPRGRNGSAMFFGDVVLTEDGRLVVGGGSDGRLQFWDATSGRALWTMHAHSSFIIGLRIDGQDIVTRSFTGELARWSIAASDEVIRMCGTQALCAGVLK